MGMIYSSMSCNNEQLKCSYNQQTYNDYNNYSKTIKNNPNEQKLLNSFVCGSHTGTVNQCCSNTGSFKNIVPNKYFLPIYDTNGKLTEYRNCKCGDNDPNCVKTHCVGFKPATGYDLCKARSINPEDTIYVDKYVDKIIAANSYQDCYSPCK